MDGRIPAQLRHAYESSGQAHVFRFVDSLSDAELKPFVKQLQEFDPDAVTKVHAKTAAEAATPHQAARNVLPLPRVDSVSTDAAVTERWRLRGLDEIAAGRVSALLLAGGQGTRLGFDHPKGMYNVGLPSGKSLYQLQAERIAQLQLLAQRHAASASVPIIPWYVMTSDATYQETCDYLTAHAHFGLAPENVVVFNQQMFPCVTPEGKIILEAKNRVATAPNGNGGLFLAMEQMGVLADMKRRGVHWALQYCVDNALVKVADPVYVGYLCESDSDCSSKVVAKATPTEPVGVLALVDGKTQVLEYSEIDPSLAAATDPQGQLIFNAAHICVNAFSLPFLLKTVEVHRGGLAYHIAKKKIPYVDEAGVAVSAPAAINGWKLESFIFDVFAHAQRFSALLVPRNDEFSPLKNAPGSPSDCPATCCRHIAALHRRFLCEAGAILGPALMGEETLIEISPLVSYAGEGLEWVRGKQFDVSPLSIDRVL